MILPDGESRLDTIINCTRNIALGAAADLLFAPIPGSRVASAAIWSSNVTSTAANSVAIYQRWDKGFSNLKDDGLDVLGIVGNVFAAGWLRHAGQLNFTSKQGVKAGSYMLYGQVGTDAASGVILTTEAYEQIEEV